MDFFLSGTKRTVRYREVSVLYVRYRNYKYAPLKGLDTRCVVKTTSDVRKSHVRAREAKRLAL